MPGLISLNGVDLAATLDKLPTRGVHGQPIYESTKRRLLVWDDNIRFWLAMQAAIVSGSSPRYVADDFQGDALDAGWAVANGLDAQAVDFAHVALATDPEGSIVGTTGNAGDTFANDGIAIATPLTFRISTSQDGTIEGRAKVKLGNVTNAYLWVGFTDVLPTTTLEAPVTLATTTYTSNASNACGIIYDTAATTKTIRAVGVAADVDATHVNTSIVPVINTYNDVRIQVSSAGVMKVWIDDVLVATVADAVGTTTDLTFMIAACSRTTTSITCTAGLICAK